MWEIKEPKVFVPEFLQYPYSMRYNNNKLSLKNISQDDKEKIATDVLLGVKTGFLNGVDLSTQEGKQKYIDSIIAGKNPFKNVKDEELDNENKDGNTTTSWADIINKASGDDIDKVNFSFKTPFKNPLLNIAYNKKLEEIKMETALSSDEISVRMLDEYTNTASAKISVASAVKFFYKMSSSIFTECNSCGGENSPAWAVCQHCGVMSDEAPLKRKNNN
jgi:hypothetical protein